MWKKSFAPGDDGPGVGGEEMVPPCLTPQFLYGPASYWKTTRTIWPNMKARGLLLLYRDLSEDIYLTDHSTVFHTINNR